MHEFFCAVQAGLRLHFCTFDDERSSNLLDRHKYTQLHYEHEMAGAYLNKCIDCV